MKTLLAVPRWLARQVRRFKDLVSGEDMREVYGEHPNGEGAAGPNIGPNLGSGGSG